MHRWCDAATWMERGGARSWIGVTPTSLRQQLPKVNGIHHFSEIYSIFCKSRSRYSAVYSVSGGPVRERTPCQPDRRNLQLEAPRRWRRHARDELLGLQVGVWRADRRAAGQGGSHQAPLHLVTVA